MVRVVNFGQRKDPPDKNFHFKERKNHRRIVNPTVPEIAICIKELRCYLPECYHIEISFNVNTTWRQLSLILPIPGILILLNVLEQTIEFYYLVWPMYLTKHSSKNLIVAL